MGLMRGLFVLSQEVCGATSSRCRQLMKGRAQPAHLNYVSTGARLPPSTKGWRSPHLAVLQPDWGKGAASVGPPGFYITLRPFQPPWGLLGQSPGLRPGDLTPE